MNSPKREDALLAVLGLDVPEAPANAADSNHRKLRRYLESVFPDDLRLRPKASVHIASGSSILPYLDALMGCETVRADPDGRQLRAYAKEYQRLPVSVRDFHGRAEDYLKSLPAGSVDHITVFNLFNYDDRSGGYTHRGGVDELLAECVKALGYGANKSIQVTDDIVSAAVSGKRAGKRTPCVLEDMLSRLGAEWEKTVTDEQMPLEGTMEDGENYLHTYRIYRVLGHRLP